MVSKQLSGFTFKTKRHMYPWEEWSNGKVHEVNSKKVYGLEPKDLCVRLHQHAKLHGKRVETRSEGDVLQFQMLDREGSPKKSAGKKVTPVKGAKKSSPVKKSVPVKSLKKKVAVKKKAAAPSEVSA